MAEICSVEMCKSSSRTQCHCCRKNFCRNHFIEHDNLPNLQLNSLIDEANLLNNRLISFNMDKVTGNSHQKLEEWRNNSHKMIDYIYEKKCREIDQRAKHKIEEQRVEMNRIRSIIDELIQKQETTMKDIDLLQTRLHTIEEKVNKVEKTYFNIVVRPFVIDDSLIHIEELDASQPDFSILSPPHKTINGLDSNSSIITSNGRFFMMYQASNLYVMDQELRAIKRTEWNHDLIRDICWSSTIDRFFVITKTNVYIVDDNNMSIECVKLKDTPIWFSCTCSDTAFYLSAANIGSRIFQFSLFPSLQVEKIWTSPQTCGMAQLIRKIVYSNEKFALVIFDMLKKEKLIELRSSTAFERLWSLQLNVEFNQNISWCCSLNRGDWLVWDSYTSSLLHITKDGQLQTTTKYNEQFSFVCLYDGNKLVIVAGERIHLHQLNCIN